MKKIVTSLLVLTSLILLSACTKNNETNKTTEGIKVVTTFYPMYDFTTKIVGDNGEVDMLISGEVEPHDYEPSAKDIARIQSADVFIYSSKEMETWVSSVLNNIDTKKTKVIEASSGIELLTNEDAEAHEHDHNEEEYEEEHHDDSEEHHHELDPHVWLSPELADKQAMNILTGIQAVDSSKKERYEENYTQFASKIKDLDNEFKKSFENATNKTFVTQHAAFGYLANEYGLEQVSIAGLTPDVEPSPKQLGALQDFVNKEKVEYIYVEQSGSSKYAETIAKATGADILTLSTLETVSTQDIKDGQDYFSIMEKNLEALKKSIK